jgi:hypothetical protein
MAWLFLPKDLNSFFHNSWKNEFCEASRAHEADMMVEISADEEEGAGKRFRDGLAIEVYKMAALAVFEKNQYQHISNKDKKA